MSGCIFAAEASIDNQKKNLLNNDTSSTCAHNIVNPGLLSAEICWRVWGTRSNFHSFRVWTALLHGTGHSSSERQPNFAPLNRGHHLCSAGRQSRWTLAHIVVGTVLQQLTRFTIRSTFCIMWSEHGMGIGNCTHTHTFCRRDYNAESSAWSQLGSAVSSVLCT